MTDTLVDVRFPYLLTGTVGRGRKTFVVTGIETVPVQSTPVEEAPLAFLVDRELDRLGEKNYRKCHGLGEFDEVPNQGFEYRVVDGVLMRGLLQRDGVTPLTLDDLVRSELDYEDRDADGRVQFYYWIDHPAPRPAFACLDFEGGRDAASVDMRKIVEDGRTAAHADLLAVFDNGVRVVDGRLFKASPPPCWALSRSRRQAEGADTIVGRLVAVDYDYPDLVTKLGDSTFMSKMDDACMPFALVGDDDKSAFSHGVVGAERAFPVVDRLEVHAISGDFDALLDPHRLRLLRDHVVSALDEVAWSKVPLGLRGPLAVLQETLEAGCFGDGPTTHRLGQVRRLLERIAPRVVLLDGVVGSLYVEVFKMTAEAVPLTLAGEDPLPDEDFSEFAP